MDDDATAGYGVGAIWVNTTTGDTFILTDATDGAANWEPMGGGGVSDHGALTGLTDDDHTQYVLKRYGGKEVVSTVAATGATETIDLANGNVFDETLSADCTFTFAGRHERRRVLVHTPAPTGRHGRLDDDMARLRRLGGGQRADAGRDSFDAGGPDVHDGGRRHRLVRLPDGRGHRQP